MPEGLDRLSDPSRSVTYIHTARFTTFDGAAWHLDKRSNDLRYAQVSETAHRLLHRPRAFRRTDMDIPHGLAPKWGCHLPDTAISRPFLRLAATGGTTP